MWLAAWRVTMIHADKMLLQRNSGRQGRDGMKFICIVITVVSWLSFCKSYTDPAKVHRRGCFLKSNKEIEQTKKKKINPLKASKRARRR